MGGVVTAAACAFAVRTRTVVADAVRSIGVTEPT
jgi:hypothetical protein